MRARNLTLHVHIYCPTPRPSLSCCCASTETVFLIIYYIFPIIIWKLLEAWKLFFSLQPHSNTSNLSPPFSKNFHCFACHNRRLSHATRQHSSNFLFTFLRLRHGITLAKMECRSSDPVVVAFTYAQTVHSQRGCCIDRVRIVVWTAQPAGSTQRLRSPVSVTHSPGAIQCFYADNGTVV